MVAKKSTTQTVQVQAAGRLISPSWFMDSRRPDLQSGPGKRTVENPSYDDGLKIRPTGRSGPAHEDAEEFFLVLQKAFVGGGEAIGRDSMRNQAGGVEAAIGEGSEQPVLRFVDVPGAGQSRMGR